MHKKLKQASHLATLTLVGFTCNCLAEGTVPAGSTTGALSSGSSEKPAWLTELSAGVKESYDTSVFLSSVEPRYYTSPALVPAGGVAAVKDAASWLTTISPKMGVNFVPLLGEQHRLQTVSLTYAPDFVFYHEQPSENFDAQRVAASIKGGTDAFSFALDDTFSYVDGSKFAPTYPGNDVTAWNTVFPRERRKQIQERALPVFQYDWQRWFVRPTASFTDYDLMIEHFDLSGYQNYVSRYDVNGGADVGFKILPQLTLTLGYRYGHQYQDTLSFSPYESSDDYQRALLGIEGKPLTWLSFKVQGGPDFRSYGPNAPVKEPHEVTYFGEASVTAIASPKDAFTIKYKQYQWVSSCGKVPYFDSMYDVNYHHKISNQWGLDLDGRLVTADYTSGDLSSSARDDWQYTVSAGLAYALNTHVTLTLGYALNLGRNEQDAIANPDTRQYEEQLISLGAMMKF